MTALKCKNSWGADFGINGYFWVTIDAARSMNFKCYDIFYKVSDLPERDVKNFVVQEMVGMSNGITVLDSGLVFIQGFSSVFKIARPSASRPIRHMERRLFEKTFPLNIWRGDIYFGSDCVIRVRNSLHQFRLEEYIADDGFLGLPLLHEEIQQSVPVLREVLRRESFLEPSRIASALHMSFIIDVESLQKLLSLPQFYARD
jgi:hypothetical protein